MDNYSSVEIGAPYTEFCFSFGLKKTHIDFGQDFNFHNTADKQSSGYIARSTSKLILDINTNKRIYEIDDHKDAFYEVIDNASLTDPLISVFEKEVGAQGKEVLVQEGEVFSIKDFAVATKKQSSTSGDNILFTLKGHYKSDTRFFDFKSSNIDARIKYYFDDSSDENKEYDRMIEVQKLYVDLDDAFLDTKGAVKLTRTDVPNGQFTVSMKYYDRIINTFVPQDFILSQGYIKKIISKAILNSGMGSGSGEQVKFEVKFSGEGVLIGKFNILRNRVTDR